MNSVNLAAASSQYLSIAYATQTGLNITGDITIEAMFRPTTIPALNGQQMGIAAMYYISGGPIYNYQWSLIQDSGTQISWRYGLSGSPAVTNNYSATHTMVPGNWYHIAITHATATGEIKFYQDGTLIGTSAGVAGARADVNVPFVIGTRQSGAPFIEFIDGDFDYMRVWNTVRSQADLDANKCLQITTGTGLVSAWNFTGDLTDSGPSGNTLTNNNSATFITASPIVDGTSPCAPVFVPAVEGSFFKPMFGF